MKFVHIPLRLIIRSVTCASISIGSVAVFGVPSAQAQENVNADAGPYPIDPYSAPRPSLRALGVAEEIRIDGRLDEAAWSRADTTGEFIQIQPNPGYPMTERTVIRIMYDEDNVYIGAELFDSEPDQVSIPGLEQDYQTHDSDIFGISIDSYYDKQSAFLFAVNPGGAVFDAQSFNDSRYINRAWEGVIHVKTTIHEEGWTAEIAIPVTTLRFSSNEAEMTWGLNFSRRIRRKSEEGNWAPMPRQFRLYKMSMAGTLTGIQNLQQGRNLYVKPYVSAARQDGEEITAGANNEFDAGFDVKYGITSRLTLDLTAFTDFSQVEVDQEQVNLTRFSLFFPEKRDFFLENDGVFAFSDINIRNYRTGSSNRNFNLFHSRRIGLNEDREPHPIAAGGRLTGRIGGLDVGLLNVQTTTDGDLPAENFSVVRLKGDLIGTSDVGVIFVNRQGTSTGTTGDYNRSFGLDANFQLLGNMVVNSYVAATDEPNASGNRVAGMFQVAWRDPLWDISTLVKHVGDGFNPEVGFVDRRGVRQLYATVGAHPEPDIPGLLRINPYAEVRYYSDLDWTLETRELKGGLGVTFMDGSVLTLGYEDNFERLNETTYIAGVEVPTGDYGFNTKTVSYRSSGERALSGMVAYSQGGFYDGDRRSVGGNIQFRPSHHLAFDVGVQHNALNLAGNDFTADLLSGRFRYAFNTKLFLMGFVQYNESTEDLVTYLRLNILHAPLSDIFLVFSERRNVTGGVFDGALVLDRMVTAKITRLIAF